MRFLRVPTFYVLSRYKKNNVYPYKPQFYFIKVGFKGVKIIQACFCDGVSAEKCIQKQMTNKFRSRYSFTIKNVL